MFKFLVGATVADAAFSTEALTCPDTIDGDYTCQQQKDWGKCGEDWMIGNCCQTCFGCADGCGASPAPSPAPSPTPGPTCPDTIDGDYTCQEQKDWGKCGEDWMIGNCCQTCFGCADGCGASPAPSPAPTPSPTPGPTCPDTIGGDATCQEQKDWGKCGEDWMIGNCCQTCFNCADGCGQKIPPKPACADHPFEPEGAPGAAAAALFAQLTDAWKTQSTTFSGQTNNYWDDLVKVVQKHPALKGFDMQNYSPRNPWHDDWSSWDDGTVQNAIDWYKSTDSKGIVQFQWHWFSPMGGNLSTSTFYSENTDFDTAKSVISGTDENTALLRDLNAIATQLVRLQTAGVPVLWRPLHEARGNDAGAWFWWGRGGPTVTKQILDLMRDVFLNQHKLDNLIWVWSEPDADWYPGNDKIDIVGFDSYPDAPQCNEGQWNQLLDMTSCKKMLTIAEVGAIPDIDACHDKNIQWLYFMAWGDLVTKDNEADHLSSVFGSSHVKSLEDLSASSFIV